MLIRGARVIDPANGLDKICDILIKNGVIAAVGEALSAPMGSEVLDAAGLVACPGLIDMHVHLRDPGFIHKEDISTGCAAAVAGGFTSVVCMPNTKPVCDTPEIVSYIRERAENVGLCRVYPTAAITLGEQGGALTDFAALKAAGAVALTDDGRPVEDPDLMERAVEQAALCGMLVISHCEDLAIVNGGIMHKGVVSEELGVPGISRDSEDSVTLRECEIALRTGGRVHIAHVSTEGSVDIIRRAKAQGARVTAETAPHYLLLTDELLHSRDANFRMNPPLRELSDIAEVRHGLRDGTLDCIITDHAPHTAEEKADFLRAPNGVVGLETSLAATLTALHHGDGMKLSRIVELMSTAPARVLGIPGGTLSVGAAADITLFDVGARWVVTPEAFHGKSKNTPFMGMELSGRVTFTILGGRLVYERV